MNPFLDAVLSGAVSGVIATASVTSAVVTYNFVKENRVRKKLKKIISPKIAGIGVDGFSITLENDADIPIIVREVVLQCEPRGVMRNLAIPLEYRPPRHWAVAPVQILPGSLLEMAQAERKFKCIPPHCEAVWGLPPAWLTIPQIEGRQADKIIGCKVEVEYQNTLRQTVIMTVEAQPNDVPNIAGMYECFIKDDFKKMVTGMQVSPPPTNNSDNGHSSLSVGVRGTH